MEEDLIKIVKEAVGGLQLSTTEHIEKKLSEVLMDTSGAFSNNQLPSEIEQRNLQSSWLLLKHAGHVYQDFDDVGFRVFSQNNEDGILLYLFTMLGTVNKTAIEIGANCGGSKIGFPECNTANLVVNHGWNSLILDGADSHVGQLTHFFASALNTKHFHWYQRRSLRPNESYYHIPLVRQALITRENINEIISNENIRGEIDLLSIDVDGMDYWIWDAVDVVTPRIVTIEYNNRISPELAVTVPYEADYVVDLSTENIWDYNGASLRALEKLGKKKGYTLVGVNSNRINAFFVRDDLLKGFFEAIDVASLYSDQKCIAIQKDDFFKQYQGLMEQV